MNLLETEGMTKIMTVSSMNKYTNNSLNWLGMINSQLTKESQVTEDTEILIEKPEMILKVLELMKVTPIT